MKKLLNVFLLIVIILSVFSFGFFIVHLLDFEKKHYAYDDTWVNGIGTITQNSQSKTRSKMKYSYNGISYTESSYYSVATTGCKIGEQYIIKINPEDPSRYVPIDWMPVFDDSEKTLSTTGVVEHVQRKLALSRNKDYSDYVISFSYAVGDTVRYTRGQVIAPAYTLPKMKIREGDKFLVKYYLYDNARSIIYFDQPINSGSSTL